MPVRVVVVAAAALFDPAAYAAAACLVSTPCLASSYSFVAVAAAAAAALAMKGGVDLADDDVNVDVEARRRMTAVGGCREAVLVGVGSESSWHSLSGCCMLAVEGLARARAGTLVAEAARVALEPAGMVRAGPDMRAGGHSKPGFELRRANWQLIRGKCEPESVVAAAAGLAYRRMSVGGTGQRIDPDEPLS